MNQPEAKKTQEGIEDRLCHDPEVPGVFFNSCTEAVVRVENDGRAKEVHALPPSN